MISMDDYKLMKQTIVNLMTIAAMYLFDEDRAPEVKSLHEAAKTVCECFQTFEDCTLHVFREEERQTIQKILDAFAVLAHFEE